MGKFAVDGQRKTFYHELRFEELTKWTRFFCASLSKYNNNLDVHGILTSDTSFNTKRVFMDVSMPDTPENRESISELFPRAINARIAIGCVTVHSGMMLFEEDSDNGGWDNSSNKYIKGRINRRLGITFNRRFHVPARQTFEIVAEIDDSEHWSRLHEISDGTLRVSVTGDSIRDIG